MTDKQGARELPRREAPPPPGVPAALWNPPVDLKQLNRVVERLRAWG